MASSQTVTRLGIVGAGVIGTRHLAAIAASDVAELVAIADPSTQADKTAADAGVPFYPDIEAMLSDTKVDGVIVATPTEHHFKPTMQALEAGVHVLVEKPIMPTLEEAAQVIDASAKTGNAGIGGTPQALLFAGA